MTELFVHFRAIALLLAITATFSEAASCSGDADCPHDQCCGRPTPDIFHLFQTCQPYSQEGQACRGSLISAICECLPGLTCVEHTGLSVLLHTSKGICHKQTEAINQASGILGK